MGEVKNVAIRCAVVRTHDGEDIIVPNSEFVSQRVRNWTYGDNWRRIKIPFGVSYDADPDEVAKIAIEAAREVPTTVEDYRHPIRVRFEGFGDNSLNFFLKVWCRMTELRGDHGYMSDYYFVLFKKFKEAGIEIPFPQRDINIKHVSPDILKELSK
ncbi:MAG TPA: mechanosensitive ion channel [Deltaproteobacteria bacterium]|nr:mechanosensitive ion channel [Deltaproteobacteria bacterium]